jgi:hypothetical protein
MELQIGNGVEIAFQHFPISRETQPLTVARNVGMNEVTEVGPVLPVEAIDIVPVNRTEVRRRHG